MKACFYIVLLFLLSCKIEYKFNDADIPESATTVSVDYFESTAALAPPTLSPLFTEALRDIMQTQTRLDLKKNQGDIQFSGTITSYRIQPVAIQSNETAAMNRLSITVAVKYINTIEEGKDFEKSFTRFTDYSSEQSLSSIETELIEEVNDQLVQDIFNAALSNW